MLTLIATVVFSSPLDIKSTLLPMKHGPSGRHLPTKEQVRSLKEAKAMKNTILEKIDLYPQPVHRIQNNGFIMGRAYDQTDNGVSAQVFAIDTVNEYQFSTVTDDSGYYNLYVLNSTYIMLAIPFDDFHITGFAFDVDVNDDTVEVDIFAPALIYDADIYGTVTDTSGTPLHAALVAAVPFGFDEELIFDAWTDDYGHYGLNVIGLGEQRPYWVMGVYESEVLDEELIGLVDSVIVNSYDSLEINLVLQAISYDGSIFGEVTFEGGPLNGVPVWAENVGTDDYFETYTNTDGYYEMGLNNGDYEVCANYWVVDDLLCETITVDSNAVEVNFDFEDQPLDGLMNHFGNFRFFWTNHGFHGAGFWPAIRDFQRSYLAFGGIITLAYENAAVMLGGLMSEAWESGDEGMYTYVENETEYIFRSMTDTVTGIFIEELIVSKGLENFTVVLSHITNDGDAELTDVRLGYIMNWDVANMGGGQDDIANDDLVGVRTIEVPHPILTVMIPVKISYMMDDDGDNGQSPGYVGFATVPQSIIPPTHISFVLDDESADILAILEQEEDNENATETADYVTLQMVDLYDFSPGDTANFATLLLAAETLDDLDIHAEQAMQRLFDLTMIVGVDGDITFPNQYTLHQNYPNPFNPVTTLQYDLPENGLVNITIYDMLGREVKTLINQTQDAGYKSVIWNATNDYGKPVSAGIYLYQIQAGEYISTKKMVLLK